MVCFFLRRRVILAQKVDIVDAASTINKGTWLTSEQRRWHTNVPAPPSPAALSATKGISGPPALKAAVAEEEIVKRRFRAASSTITSSLQGSRWDGKRLPGARRGCIRKETNRFKCYKQRETHKPSVSSRIFWYDNLCLLSYVIVNNMKFFFSF